MADFERRLTGVRRVWQIASEKSLDEMYRCIFGWEEPDMSGPGRPDIEEIDEDSPAGES